MNYEEERLEPSNREVFDEMVDIVDSPTLFDKSVLAQNLRREADPRVLKARRIREEFTPRENKGGSVSTHLMVHDTRDGKHLAWPTLFPAESGDWKEYTREEDPYGEKALEEARSRGEVFEFNTIEEAEAFAKGNWKETEPALAPIGFTPDMEFLFKP